MDSFDICFWLFFMNQKMVVVVMMVVTELGMGCAVNCYPCIQGEGVERRMRYNFPGNSALPAPYLWECRRKDMHLLVKGSGF